MSVSALLWVKRELRKTTVIPAKAGASAGGTPIQRGWEKVTQHPPSRSARGLGGCLMRRNSRFASRDDSPETLRMINGLQC